MQKIVLAFLITILFSCFAQAQSNNVGKKSSYTVKKEPNTSGKKDKCMFNIKFIGADGTPHKSGARLIINNDTIFPKIDAQGNYHSYLPPGKYKIFAFVPYWQDVITDSIVFKKDQVTTIRMKFEALEIRKH
jgi:hypothetical protein